MSSFTELGTLAQIAQSSATPTSTAAVINDYNLAVNTIWQLLTAFLIFQLLLGLVMLEVGLIRKRGNVASVAAKSIAVLLSGILIWWAVGFPFALGDKGSANWFIGLDGFFLANFDACGSDSSVERLGEAAATCTSPWSHDGLTYATWVQNLLRALVVAMFASAGLAERGTLLAHVLLTCTLVGFTYPVLHFWSRTNYGWISPYYSPQSWGRIYTGAMDWAGAGIIFMTAGAAAFVAQLLMGRRTFPENVAPGVVAAAAQERDPNLGPGPARGGNPLDFSPLSHTKRRLMSDDDSPGSVASPPPSPSGPQPPVQGGADPASSRKGPLTRLIERKGVTVRDRIATLAAMRQTIGGRRSINSASSATLGLFFIIMGWFGLITSGPLISDGYYTVIGNAALNLLLAAATGGLMTLLLVGFCVRGAALMTLFIKGTIAGMIAVSSCAPAVLSYGAVAIGGSSALVFLFFNRFSVFLKLDDPLDIIALGYWVGFYGLMMAGLFPTSSLTRSTVTNPNMHYGAFYQGSGELILTNLILACLITGWTLATVSCVLTPLALLRLLRKSVKDELLSSTLEFEETGTSGSAAPAGPGSYGAGVGQDAIPQPRIQKRFFDCW